MRDSETEHGLIVAHLVTDEALLMESTLSVDSMKLSMLGAGATKTSFPPSHALAAMTAFN